MLSPEAIVEQVWQRIVPTDWKIIRGKRRSAFSLGVSATIWTFAGIVLLAILAVVLNDVRSGTHTGSDAPLLRDILALQGISIAGYPILLVGVAAVAALPLLVGLITWIASARRHAGDPDPVIVLVPEGFVEYVSQRKPIIGILYADLAAVDIWQRRRSRSSPPGSHTPTPPRTKAWLDLVYHDGNTGRWMPRANFGPPERLYETIIKAHTLYDILYGGGR